jgi:hypothetical protein
MEEFFKHLNLKYDEQERIRDIVQKHGGVNWKDALGASQFLSKLPLIEQLEKFISPQDSVVIIGGWIGLIPYLMTRKQIACAQVVNIEIDQMALQASDVLNEETSFSYERLYEDAMNVEYSQWKNLIVINTSCEHLSAYDSWIAKIPAGTKCILQSNNMFGLPEHVNCHKDLDDFSKRSGLSQIQTKNEIDIGDTWNRFMLTGLR